MGEEKYMQGFGRETWKYETIFKTQGSEGRIILKWILNKEFGSLLSELI
jgi:hypothetical protein